MADYFPSDAVVRRVNIEPALFIGAGRALALQLAHPAVAHGVQDHSEFRRNPFTRLQGTLEATVSVTFGSEELARSVGRRIQWIHEFVVGPSYAANDPDNLLWVHATLVDTALRCYTRFVGPLTDAERETYYQEMKRVAAVFGVPDESHPPTLADFEAYFDMMVSTLEVTDTGRELTAFILDPELPLRLDLPMAPLLRWQRLSTIALLPEPIRDQLGLALTRKDAARWRRLRRRIALANRSLPRSVRIAPTVVLNQILLRQGAAHVRDFEGQMAARSAV